ncbi:MAG TPA: L,D-transpeptidase [Acidimicrobiales bacterium]|nr:L,D-transpeptidase [Acidimicrobiales bacterium]
MPPRDGRRRLGRTGLTVAVLLAVLCTGALVSVAVLAPVGRAPARVRPPGPVPATTSTVTTPAPVALPSQPATVATVTVPTLPVYPWPGAVNPGRQLTNPNELGAPLVLLALATEGTWVETYLPERPNEATGWVPLADVSLSADHLSIVIGLGARQLTLYHDQTPVFETSVAPGEPSSPTPTGTFYVTEDIKLTDPGSAYGPYALGTSAFSNTYYQFEGGPGQVAIHGTNQPWLIGGYASHGCVRLTNAAITTLAQQVPAGTPVQIDP